MVALENLTAASDHLLQKYRLKKASNVPSEIVLNGTRAFPFADGVPLVAKLIPGTGYGIIGTDKGNTRIHSTSPMNIENGNRRDGDGIPNNTS